MDMAINHDNNFYILEETLRRNVSHGTVVTASESASVGEEAFTNDKVQPIIDASSYAAIEVYPLINSPGEAEFSSESQQSYNSEPMLTEGNLGIITLDEVIHLDADIDGTTIAVGSKPSLVRIKGSKHIAVYNGKLISEEEAKYSPSACLEVVKVAADASDITISGGTSVDIVHIDADCGNNITVAASAGNDNLVAKGGTGHLFVGGQGNDRYILKNLEEAGIYTIDQSNAQANDRDTLILASYLSSDFFVDGQENGDIFLVNKSNSARIAIREWYNNSLRYVIFKDKRLSAADISTINGTNNYVFKLQGNYHFTGDNEIAAEGSILWNGSRNDSLTVSGNDNVMHSKGGDVLLVAGSNNTIMTDTSGGSVTIDGGEHTEIVGGSANSYIYINGGSDITVNGGEKQEIIYIYGGSNINANLNAGRDIIYAYGGQNIKLQLGTSTDYNYVFCSKDCLNYDIDATEARARITIRGGEGYVIKCGDFDNDISLEGGIINRLDSGNGAANVYLRGTTIYMDGTIVNGLVFEKGSNTIYFDNINTDQFVAGASNDMLVVNSGYIGSLKGCAGSDTYVLNCLEQNGKYTIDQLLDNNIKENGGDFDQLFLKNYNSADFSMRKDSEGNLILDNKVNNASITISGWQVNPLQRICFNDKTLDTNAINQGLKPKGEFVTQQQVILDMMTSFKGTLLKGTEAFDEAVVACSQGLYSSAKDLINSFKNVCLTKSGTSNEAVKRFLLDYCGVNLDNADTGAITGLDAGGVEKTRTSVVPEPEGMTIDDLTYDFSQKVTATDYYYNTTKEYSCVKLDFKGETLTIYWDEADMRSHYDYGYIEDIKTLETITAGVVKAWVKPALELVEESYGISLTGNESTLSTLSDGSRGLQLIIDYASSNVNSKYAPSLGGNWLAAVSSSPTTNKVDDITVTSNTKAVLLVNSYFYQNGITNIDGMGGLTVQCLDRVIAHELVHGAMAANMNNFNSLHSFLKEGLAELVHGIDDDRRSSILTVFNSSATLSENGVTYNHQQFLDKIFNLDTPNYRVPNYSYAASYVLLRYLAKTVSDYSLTQSNSANLASANLLGLKEAELNMMDNGLVENMLDNNELVHDINASLKLSSNI